MKTIALRSSTYDDFTQLPITMLGICENKAIARIQPNNISTINRLIKEGKKVDPLLIEYANNYYSDVLACYELK